jgi:carbamoyltransferase
VKANKRIRELPEVEDVFFYPAADDGGTPVGAALEVYHRLCEKRGLRPGKSVLADLYYGQEFADSDIEAAIAASPYHGSAAEIPEGMAEAVSEMLVQGKIVARFDGRDEWGPRALGNRSILADPRDLRVIRKINFAIKQRDFWMPFAVSLFEEDLHHYLLNGRPARYMIEAFDTTPRGEDLVAGTHPFDRTARPQTVNDWNPGWRRIIEGFRDRTGVGGVLNTSFNLHGFPIVGTPEAALYTFENSALDALAIGNWLITRN